MSEKKNSDPKSKKKLSREKESRKHSHSNDREARVSLLKYGTNSNFHIWKEKLYFKATQQYGRLARLLKDDKYFKVKKPTFGAIYDSDDEDENEPEEESKED